MSQPRYRRTRRSRGPKRIRRTVGVSAGLLFGSMFIVEAVFPRESVYAGSVPAGGLLGLPDVMPVSSDCTSCHHFDRVLSHPIGVVPSMPVPAWMPLEDGRLTCVTCHEPREGHPSAGAVLRADSGPGGLCVQCHSPSANGLKGGHADGRVRAHLIGGGAGGRPGLDEESRDCLSCHDGTAAGDAGSHAGISGLFTVEGSHPIGMRYPSPGERRTSSEARLVDIARLPLRIRLFDQTVGCGSCHSVYSQQAGLLVTSNLRSRLCLSCHIE